MNKSAQLDRKFVWHPFTQMRDWLKREPIVIASGQGAVLRDVKGREYLDANSSIWTNLHGHRHPKINAAISRQLKKIAHSSALGFANEPASLLAENWSQTQSGSQKLKIGKGFFSDDGSTALEVALKLAYEFTRRTRGKKTSEISFARRRVSRRHHRRGFARPH
jgi:adenosylmethionine-8-amino-7-oxononanoate aminotransferase